jgi:NAD(P)H-nitrite reductase large subunit
MKKYLIIGGGIAGTTAAEEIRKIDKDAEIIIIEQESHRLYSRVLLPHYIEGKVDREKVFLKKLDWYDERNIELFTGVRVENIDVKNGFVLTSEKRELPFDKLLLTTGGGLQLIDQDLRGVSYLRSLDDADHLRELLAEIQIESNQAKDAIVLGGGFISLEYINIFAKFKLKTTVVQRSGFWSRVLSQESREVLVAHLKNHDIDIVQDSIQGLVGEKELSGVKLASGKELSAGILGVGIGNKLDQSILMNAGIMVDGGILADVFLKTNIENVYTAGDVAQFQDSLCGRQIQHGNFMNAIMQARVVAKTMTGKATKFELVSSYGTDVLGMHVVFIGDTSREHATEVVQVESEPGSALEIFNRDGKTVGAAIIGDVKKRQEITNAIRDCRKVTF